MRYSEKYRIPKRYGAFSPVTGLVLLLAALLLPAGESHAVLEDFSPYAYTRVLYDSNVFRLAGDNEAITVLGDTNRDDTIAYLGAGLKSDLKLSRQHLFLDAEVTRAKYDNFSELDHTRIKGRAAWGWRVGNLWSGNLGYLHRRELTSFNQRTTPGKDMRTTQTVYFDAGYQIHPDLAVVGVLNHIETSYQDRDRLDRDSNAAQIEFQYKNTLNTKVGIRAKFTDFELKKQQDVGGVLVNNDYKETEISGVFYWQGTAKSSFEARLGYTSLKYDELDERDYEGTSGRLTYFWAVTGKTRLNIAAWRETSSLANEITTYVLSKGISIEPSWSVTPKVTVKGTVSYKNEDFKGENGIRAALGQEKRDDDTWLYRLAASWKPRDFLDLTLAYRKKERDSSVDSSDYDDNQIEGRLRISF